MHAHKLLLITAAIVTAGLLAGCLDEDSEPGRFTVGGTVTGLAAGTTVVLQNNAIDDLAIDADGAFTFATTLSDGDAYEVTVGTQPNAPNQDCIVDNGAGRMPGSDVTGVEVACFAAVALEATPDGDRMQLAWNAADFDGAVFNLCRTEEAPDGGFANCAAHDGGVLDTAVTTPFETGALDTATPYWFRLEAAHGDGRRTLSPLLVRSIPTGFATPATELNDTGVDWCANDGANLARTGTTNEKIAGCAQTTVTHPGQDAVQGRDAAARAGTLVKTGSGVAGFDFTRICNNGEAAGTGACPATPTPGTGAGDWGCTRDNVTGLVWEVKVAIDNHLRSLRHSYTWFDPGQAAGDDQGVQDGGFCVATDGSCDTPEFNSDTNAFVEAVNAAGLCGASDWRLPTIDELHSVTHYGILNPALPLASLPGFVATDPDYWSATTVAGFSSEAWYMNFNTGNDGRNAKGSAYRVRLVRGGPAIPPADAADIPGNAAACAVAGLPRTTPSGDFTAVGDGSVVRHIPTGLEWQRCARGQVWDGAACAGAASAHPWGEALTDAEAEAGWRLPNLKELRSLVERCAVSPAINRSVFPDAPGAAFLSATPSAGDPADVWAVHFLSGNDNPIKKQPGAHVRLVRDPVTP